MLLQRKETFIFQRNNNNYVFVLLMFQKIIIFLQITAVSGATANVVEKWDFCYNKIKEAEESTDDTFGNRCVCFEKHGGAPDEDLSK